MASSTAVLRAEPIQLPQKIAGLAAGGWVADHCGVGGKGAGEIDQHIYQGPSSGGSQH